MSTPSDDAPVAKAKRPRRRWWRFFLQFSLRTLLVLTTLAAVACWWFLQPETREEQIAGKHLKLRRQVKVLPIEGPQTVMPNPDPNDPFAGEFALMNVGRWQLIDEHGDRLVSGRYQEGVPQGKWTVYHTSGRKAAEGSVLRGARNGKWKTWDAEGRLLSEVTYRAASQKVVFTKPIGAADLASVPWEAQRHGPARTWHANGKLKFQGTYTDDRRTGPWAFYDEQGGLTAQGEFWRDQKDGKWLEPPESGAEPREVEYVAGLLRADHEALLLRLQGDLTGGTIERQVAAVERLESLGPHAAAPLLEALGAPDDNLRAIALRALERIASAGERSPRGKIATEELLAKVEPLVDSADGRLARQAMLIVYRLQPQRRESLLAPLLAAARDTPDPELAHSILRTLLEFPSGSRQAVFNQLAALGEQQYRGSSASWGAGGPYQSPLTFLELAFDHRAEFPTLLPAAAESNDPAVRCFVLRVIDQLAREKPAATVTTAAGEEKRLPVPPQYERLVAGARSDPDPLVRQAADDIGRSVPVMPGVSGFGSGIGGGFF
jgi:hypothetical protein